MIGVRWKPASTADLAGKCPQMGTPQIGKTAIIAVCATIDDILKSWSAGILGVTFANGCTCRC